MCWVFLNVSARRRWHTLFHLSHAELIEGFLSDGPLRQVLFEARRCICGDNYEGRLLISSYLLCFFFPPAPARLCQSELFVKDDLPGLQSEHMRNAEVPTLDCDDAVSTYFPLPMSDISCVLHVLKGLI